MKKIVAILLSCAIILGSLTISAFASEKSTIQFFDDGSYCITTITDGDTFSLQGNSPTSRSTKTGTKTVNYYNSDRELCFTVYVTGTFSYNGSTATATNATYGYSISESGWSFKSGQATCSGATATATCTFRCILVTKTLSASLTCSPTGVLS